MNSYINTDGQKITPVPYESIMVSSQSDLSSLICEPGTVAYTAGFGNMWQLDAEGTWQTIVEEG